MAMTIPTVARAGRPINYGLRARIGMLLPSGNQAAEPQFAAMLPDGVSLHTTRLPLTGSSDNELVRMAERVEDAARLLADAAVDLVLFHCTAVSTFSVELEQDILSRIERAAGVPATATSQGLVAALHAVDAQRVAMLSPYIEAINLREAAFLEGAGFQIVRNMGLGCPTAREMMAVSPEEWMRHALEQTSPDADVLLISCTTVRATDVVAQIEAQLGRPVVTSNTAALWHSLRLLGIEDHISGFGRLFEAPGADRSIHHEPLRRLA